jgi:glutamine cyclotransferase
MTKTRSKIGNTKPQAPVRAAQIVREYGPFAGAERIHGVTHDGHRVWAATGSKLLAFDPESGQLARTLDRVGDAGTAFDGTHLYQIAEARIDKIDPATGDVVTWVDGELWHGTWEGDESDIRRIDPESGAVLERLAMPRGIGVSGLESDGADLFYCGGGPTGKVRAVRRPNGE